MSIPAGNMLPRVHELLKLHTVNKQTEKYKAPCSHEKQASY